MIEVAGLVVARGGAPICAVEHLSVERGERVCVVGDNGSGKSTLLKVLAGLQSHESGHCQVTVPHESRCYVHQTPYLFRGTVLFNVMYGLRARGRQDAAAAAGMLARLGLDGFAARRVGGLSGGEVRRTALARALVLTPELLLLDEPLADLDPAAIELVYRVLAELPETTVVITSPGPLPADWTARIVNLERPRS